MDPFGSDPFEDVFRNFFGGNRRRFRSEEGEGSSGVLDTVTTKEGSYLIFDFPGKTVQNVTTTKGTTRDEYGDESRGPILLIAFETGSDAQFALPKEYKKKTPEWNFTNGILEVLFRR